jgi:hypothetical protein
MLMVVVVVVVMLMLCAREGVDAAGRRGLRWWVLMWLLRASSQRRR